MGVPGSGRTVCALGSLTGVAWIDAGPADPRHEGEVRPIRAGDLFIAVASVAGDWLAFADACTHHECPLSDGVLERGTIECDCHGSIFDVRSGAVLRGPARSPIAVYPAEVRDGRIFIDVEP